MRRPAGVVFLQKRSVLWLVPGLVYLLFVAWYTDLRGPLNASEIAVFSDKLRENGMSDERIARIREFMEADSGRQFLMVNLIDLNENPPDTPGAAPGESAMQLMDRYMEHMYPELLRRASHPVLMGTAIFSNFDTLGVTGADNWTMGALMRYRSRRSLMEIITHPELMGRHEFKLAALDKTIAYPIEMNFYYSDLRLMLGLMLLGATGLLDILLFGRSKVLAAP